MAHILRDLTPNETGGCGFYEKEIVLRINRAGDDMGPAEFRRNGDFDMIENPWNLNLTAGSLDLAAVL